VEQLLIAVRWPGLALFALGGLLLLWRLLAPQLEPRSMLRWARGRVEQALVPLVGPHAAPGVADVALAAGGVALLVSAALLFLAVGAAGLLLAPPLALLVAWWVANRQAGRRRERLSEQVQGLAQALAAGLAGSGAAGGTVFALLRRYYRTMEPPLREEFGFMELVLRGQADLGDSLSQTTGAAVQKHLRALLALLVTIYRESLDVAAQRRALDTLLERLRQDNEVRHTVRIESRFGQSSQTIVLCLIPAFVVLAAAATTMLGAQVSVADFYLRTTPGRVIALGAVLVEGLVAWVSQRMVQRVHWE
jgi:Flp pilus assembly protein TadB